MTEPEYNVIVRAKSRPHSMRAAINAMCAHCMGGTSEAMATGWRQDVDGCTATDCPLNGLRPRIRRMPA